MSAYATEAIGTIARASRFEERNAAESTRSYYDRIRGTSIAIPAGVAALIISQYGGFKPANSRSRRCRREACRRFSKIANNQEWIDFTDAFALDAECDREAPTTAPPAAARHHSSWTTSNCAHRRGRPTPTLCCDKQTAERFRSAVALVLS